MHLRFHACGSVYNSAEAPRGRPARHLAGIGKMLWLDDAMHSAGGKQPGKDEFGRAELQDREWNTTSSAFQQARATDT